MNILIDTNVMLDYLCQREGFFEASNKIMEMCAKENISGFIAAHSVLNAYYILRNKYTDNERKEILLKYIEVVDVVNVLRKDIEDCLSNAEFTDMEDCLQDICAVSCDAQYIVTRNIKDFQQSKTQAILPEDFIRLMEKHLNN